MQQMENLLASSQIFGAECDHYGAVWSPWCLWPETASRWLTEPPKNDTKNKQQL